MGVLLLELRGASKTSLHGLQFPVLEADSAHVFDFGPDELVDQHDEQKGELFSAARF